MAKMSGEVYLLWLLSFLQTVSCFFFLLESLQLSFS